MMHKTCPINYGHLADLQKALPTIDLNKKKLSFDKISPRDFYFCPFFSICTCLCSHRPLLNYRYLHKVALAVLCGSTGPLSDLRYSTGPLSDLRYSTGPLSDLRYRQVRLDLGFIVRMRDHQAPLPPITADCHRLLPAIIVAWEISRGYTRRQRYQIMVVQGRGSGLDRANTWTNSVLICDLWICQEMRYSLYVRRNARFFHLYENLKLQDRLISLTHYYLDKMAIIQDTRSYSLR